MFGSVKKIISAFETRRQARPVSLPPSVPSPLPLSLNSSVSSSSPCQSLGSPSLPSCSSSSVLSKVSPLHSPVSQESRPCTLRASSPGKPCPDSTSSSPSTKRLARLSVPPVAEPSLSSLQTASPLHLSRSNENAVLRERRCKDGEGKGRVGRDIPRMRMRDSWPIGQQHCVERWCTQSFSTSAGPRSTSTARLKTRSASGSTACSVTAKSTPVGGPKISSGTPALATSATGQISCSHKGLNAKINGEPRASCTKSSISISTASSQVLIVNSDQGLPVSSSPGPSTTVPIVISSREPTISFTTGPHVTSTTGPIVSSFTGPTISFTTGLSSSSVSEPDLPTTGPAIGSVTGPNVSTTIRPTVTSTESAIDSSTGPSVGSKTNPYTISRPVGVITDSAVGFVTGHYAIPTSGSAVNSTTGPTAQAHSNRSTAVGTSLSLRHLSPAAEAQAPAAPSIGATHPSNSLKGPSILCNPQALTLCDPQGNHTAASDSRPQSVGKPMYAWDSDSNAGLKTHIAVQRISDQQGSFSSSLSLQSCCPSQGAISRPLCPVLASGYGCVGETKSRGPQGGHSLLPVAKHKLDLQKEAWCRGSEAAFLSLVLFCRG